MFLFLKTKNIPNLVNRKNTNSNIKTYSELGEQFKKFIEYYSKLGFTLKIIY